MTLPTDYSNATVLTDLHPDAHNDVNAAVNALVAAGGGSTILNGAGVPSTGLGVEGDYYLDTTNRVLYGPKGVASYGTGQRPTILNGPPDNGLSGPYSLGTQWQFVRAGRITRLRYNRNSFTLATPTLRIWDDATTTELSAVSETRTGEIGYFEITLPTAVPVAAGQTVTTAITGSLNYIPVQNGTVFATNTADVVFLHTRQINSATAFPGELNDGRRAFVEPVYEPTVAPAWPVAVYGIPAGGTTGQFLKKTGTADFAVGWVT